MITIPNTGISHNLIGMRTRATIALANVTKIESIESRGFKDCCYGILVLSDGTDDTYKNDESGFLFTKNTNSDSFDLKLIRGAGGIGNEWDLNDDTYGTFFDFGDLPFSRYKGYRLKWSNVYNLHGVGIYTIQVSGTFIGQPQTFTTSSYVLKQFSYDIADKTIRVDSIMNGYLGTNKFDYSNCQWFDSIRFNGFFGNRNPEHQLDNVVYANRSIQQVRDELINTYKLQSGIIPYCVSGVLIDYHFMADQLFISDYNRNNHQYNYKETPVILEGNDEPSYNSGSRYVRLNYTFKDRIQDKIKETV